MPEFEETIELPDQDKTDLHRLYAEYPQSGQPTTQEALR